MGDRLRAPWGIRHIVGLAQQRADGAADGRARGRVLRFFRLAHGIVRGCPVRGRADAVCVRELGGCLFDACGRKDERRQATRDYD